MPRSGAITLGDLAGKLDYFRIECSACDRSSQYRVLRLIAELGNDFPLPELCDRLTANCSKRRAASVYEQCQASFPDLRAAI
jgi:hypothetical protein